MIQKTLKILPLISFLFLITSCGNNLKFYGSFCGKIIDYSTGEPIEGVVVAASWNTINFTDKNHSLTRPAKVAEVVSDKSGEFCLGGRGITLFPYQPSIEIFKTGYMNIHDPYYPNFIESTYYEDSVKWENGKAIVKLKKMSVEERDKQYGNIGFYLTDDAVFNNNRKKFDEEVAKERTVLEEFREQRRQKEFEENRVIIPMGGRPPSKSPSRHLAE